MLKAILGALYLDVSSYGCCRRSFEGPYEGVMGVTGVNGAFFPSLKSTFFVVFKLLSDGCYLSLSRAQIRK